MMRHCRASDSSAQMSAPTMRAFPSDTPSALEKSRFAGGAAAYARLVPRPCLAFVFDHNATFELAQSAAVSDLGLPPTPRESQHEITVPQERNGVRLGIAEGHRRGLRTSGTSWDLACCGGIVPTNARPLTTIVRTAVTDAIAAATAITNTEPQHRQCRSVTVAYNAIRRPADSTERSPRRCAHGSRAGAPLRSSAPARARAARPPPFGRASAPARPSPPPFRR